MKWVFELVSHRDESSAYSTETSSNSETSLDLTDDTQQQSDDQKSDLPPSSKRKRESEELEDALSATYDPNPRHYLGNASPQKRLWIDILEQADPLHAEPSLSLPLTDDELMLLLLYLENRVGLAKHLFPMEAKIAMDIAQLDGTYEFPLTSFKTTISADVQRPTLDLNEVPFIIQEEHLSRMRALSRTVELVQRFFPQCSKILNRIMDAEDLSQLVDVGNDADDEQCQMKQRFVEPQNLIRKAFNEDKREFDRSNISSSSSS